MYSPNKLIINILLFALLSGCAFYSVTAREIGLKDLYKLSKPVKRSCYTHDGLGVNKKHPTWGSTGESFPRITKAAYTDGIKAAPRQKHSARLLSNIFCKQETCDESNKFGVNAMFYAFGQFIDHDIDSMGIGRNTEQLPIPVPTGDRFATPTIAFTRGTYSSEKIIFAGQPVNQINVITGYMDCSQIYGSDPEKANALRTLSGGLLKSQTAYGLEYMPKSFLHTNGLFFSGGPNNSIIAGDDRVTESLPISLLQTFFLREHNRLARLVTKRFGFKKSSCAKSHIDEYIFQSARAINCAQIQSITYREFLPALLGKHSVNPYRLKYNPNVRVTPSNEFATCAYRFGHSMVSCTLHRIDHTGKDHEGVEFKDAFNAYPKILSGKDELDYLVRGLCKHPSQNLDEKVVDGLRDFLFGPNVRLDLPANNIQRGRDAGLPSFNEMRKQLGLKTLTASELASGSSILKDKLVEYFGDDLADMDPWLAVLMEPKYDNSQLGHLGTKIVSDQFKKFVQGDPCFYTNSRKRWVQELRRSIDRVTLADIIQANTGIDRNDYVLSKSAFHAKY